MNLDQQLGREIVAINGLLSDHKVDAGTAPAWTVVAGGSFVVYGLRLGRAQRLAAVAALLPELSEKLSSVRGAACPVRLRLLPAALEVSHPAPAPLDWRRADLSALRPGQLLAGRSYSAAGSAQEVVSLDRSPHTLIAGMTRSGKSTLLQMAVLSLACATSPAALELRLVDLKNEDLIPLARLPHVAGVAVDRASAATMIRELHDLKDQRVAAGPGGPAGRRVVLVVDELAELAGVPGALDLLGSVVSVGASKAIHVIAATQKPVASAVGSIARAQFTTRLVGRVADAGESVIAGGRRELGAELLPGFGAFLRVDGPDVVRLQSYLLDSEGLDHYVKAARAAAGLPSFVSGLSRSLPLASSSVPASSSAAAPAAASSSAAAAPSVAAVPAALAAVFAVRYDGAGGLRRPGMAESLRALYGDAAPASGRAYQAACNEVLSLLEVWRAGSSAAQASQAGGAGRLATMHKWPGAAAGA